PVTWHGMTLRSPAVRVFAPEYPDRRAGERAGAGRERRLSALGVGRIAASSCDLEAVQDVRGVGAEHRCAPVPAALGPAEASEASTTSGGSDLGIDVRLVLAVLDEERIRVGVLELQGG